MENPQSILVLDDEVGITRLTSAMLKMHKYDVIVFNNPIEALKETQESSISVAIVDFMMPEMSGNEFLKSFKKTHPKTPCIMLSAKKLSESERKELFELKVNFLSKPFKPRELLDAVSLALSKGS
ncbi:hypothetical protein DID80_03480 [Candidatus Marinamargulisbacteria bacterium SCGC AAA071-K20]|nr:hypothetical protein DID80_03480 [Candidatus Marinamargulisbacteria bacterium SCGC AAA071-K20]